MRSKRSTLAPIILSALCAAAVPLSAQQKGTPRAPAAKDSMAGAGPASAELLNAKTISAGRDVFHGEGNCFVCHGAELEGGPIAPTLRAHQWRNGDGSFDMIFHVVTTGVPNTAMVSHPGGISDAEARQVAAYVWAVSHGKAKP
ncbi:MAG TPA: cytochrome c [Gemmatimonadales bacterium]|nr:cytochrome c [Gemmatimonadales bacterium]